MPPPSRKPVQSQGVYREEQRRERLGTIERCAAPDRYSHLQSIDPAMQPGAQIGLRQQIGVLGTEGGSGGWSHLHYDITSRQPSGQWGIQEGYAFLWEAYQRQMLPKSWRWPARITSFSRAKKSF